MPELEISICTPILTFCRKMLERMPERMPAPRRHTEESDGDLEAHQYEDADMPLFNIERDGDPRISWFMYYDFTVTKTEAFYKLQPGYLVTANYPSRINVKAPMSNGRKLYYCRFLDCKVKPFTRHYDLERHFTAIHQGGKGKGSREQGDKEQSKNVQTNCDYKKCDHTEPFRKDHCREHYREYHIEDLLKRGQPSNSKAKHGKEKPETAEESLASHTQNLTLSWWRCSKCFQRVQSNPNGQACPACNLACDPECVDWRKKGSMSFGSWCIFWNRALLPVSVMAGASMSAFFLWLNQRMELETSSNFVQQALAIVVGGLPAQAVRATQLVPSGLILASYLLASAIWSISILGWIATRLWSLYLGYWYLYILFAIIFWSLLGLTAAELFLAFLPLSIVIGVCLYVIYSGSIINSPTCERCAKGQDRRDKLTSITASPIQYQYSGKLIDKLSLKSSHKDIHVNVNG